ncbi:MAG: HAD family hydrolase [candidate division NC10 bacterium]|nr:HAD family hydrolase [candidate division NC10 bacterium]
MKPIRGILFDMDGVVVEQRLDFPAIKREIFGDTEGFILERMERLALTERARAEAILERHEALAAVQAASMDGFLPFHAWMVGRGLKSGLVTRNSRKSVEAILGRLDIRFDAVVSREDAPPKPAPDPVLLACRRMGVDPAEAVFVGDFELDLLAGRRAGVMAVLLRSPGFRSSERADLVVDSLAELRDWLEAEARSAD